MAGDESYRRDDNGIFIPRLAVCHREEEYDSSTFAILLNMQSRHFWYRGRHRFILGVLKRLLPRVNCQRSPGVRAIDIGGGCGGWIHYLNIHLPSTFGELALGDSSATALTLAREVVGTKISRYQVDLLQLQWKERWDVAFLLDVLEHIPQDGEVLEQIYKSLSPGGLLFITTPALKYFWSHNDDFAQHVRRYSRADFLRLANDTGFEVCLTRYFQFFLSPLLMLSRWRRPKLNPDNPDEVRAYFEQSHRVPPWIVNELLTKVFQAETPLGIWFPFPWGTSVLAVLRKPGGP